MPIPSLALCGFLIARTGEIASAIMPEIHLALEKMTIKASLHSGPSRRVLVKTAAEIRISLLDPF